MDMPPILTIRPCLKAWDASAYSVVDFHPFPIKVTGVEAQLATYFRPVVPVLDFDLIKIVAAGFPTAVRPVTIGQNQRHEFGPESRYALATIPLVEHNLIGLGLPPGPFFAMFVYPGDQVVFAVNNQIQRPLVFLVDFHADTFEFLVSQNVPPHGVHVFRSRRSR